MKGYSEIEVFSSSEIRLLRRARDLVDMLPWGEPGASPGPGLDGEPLRCHEIARWIGEELGLEVQDGTYGFIEHTWLWTSPRKTEQKDVYAMPNILDVYVPGSLPQVQLCHPSVTLICPYRYGPPRTDIRDKTIEALRDLRRSVL